jgi:catalase
MDGVPADILDRALGHFDKISPAYGDGIRKALAARAKMMTAAE